VFNKIISNYISVLTKGGRVVGNPLIKITTKQILLLGKEDVSPKITPSKAEPEST